MKHPQHQTYEFQQRRLKRAVLVLVLSIIKNLKE